MYCKEKGIHTCAECKMNVRECRTYNNLISKICEFIFRSDCPACIRFIRENGELSFAEEMTRRGKQTMKKTIIFKTTMELFWIISFPLAFIIHDSEEIIVQHKWVLAHKEHLIQKHPIATRIIEHLSSLSTKAFAIAVLEELILLLFATAYILIGGIYAMELWIALFMAFSIHFAVHIVQGFIVMGYVPGLATSILMLPYAYFGISKICKVVSGNTLIQLSVLGIIAMMVNLRFAHWVGKKFTH